MRSGNEAGDFEIDGYLFIELANVVAGFSPGLDIDGVALDTFSCRHDSCKPSKKNSQRPQQANKKQKRGK